MAGFSLTRLTSNWASKNSKTVFETTLFSIRQKLRRALVNVICNLTPCSNYRGTLHMSLCNGPNSWTFLLVLILFLRKLNRRLVLAVTFSAETAYRPYLDTSRRSREEWLQHLSHRSSESRDMSVNTNAHSLARC